MSDTRAVIHERLAERPPSAPSTGYAWAKWVAEHVCDSAHETILPNRVVIVRVGQLCGDTEHGIWNESEMWPLLIASMRYTGCLPVLPDEVSNIFNLIWRRWLIPTRVEELSLLPFDIAASSLLDVVTCDTLPQSYTNHTPIVHILNPRSVPWVELLRLFEMSGLSFDTVPNLEWFGKLEARISNSQTPPATRGLQDMWNNMVCLEGLYSIITLSLTTSLVYDQES